MKSLGSRDILKKESQDKLLYHFTNEMRDKISDACHSLTDVKRETLEAETLIRIGVQPSPEPIFNKTPIAEMTGIFIRNQNTTISLNDQAAFDYVLRRWLKSR